MRTSWDLGGSRLRTSWDLTGSRLRWEDQIGKDLRRLGAGIDNTENRQEYRKIVGEAENHLGFMWSEVSK